MLLERLSTVSKWHKVCLNVLWLFPEFCLITTASVRCCWHSFCRSMLTSYFLFCSSFCIYFVDSGRSESATVVSH